MGGLVIHVVTSGSSHVYELVGPVDGEEDGQDLVDLVKDQGIMSSRPSEAG